MFPDEKLDNHTTSMGKLTLNSAFKNLPQTTLKENELMIPRIPWTFEETSSRVWGREARPKEFQTRPLPMVQFSVQNTKDTITEQQIKSVK